MRFFSLTYHGLLALFLLAISLVTLSTGTHSLHMEFLPWDGKALTYWLLVGSLFGLLTVVLAWRRTLTALFLLWSFAVLALLLRGYFLSGYYFDDGDELRKALYLTAGAILAAMGAWFEFRWRPAEKLRR